MLISHSHKFIYLKTTKTAGTSVEMALQHCALPDGMRVSDKVPMPIVSSSGVVGARGMGMKAREQEWYNHMPAAEIRSKLPEDVWDSYFKFCNLRNPWDKTVSWFHFQYWKDVSDLTVADTIAAFRKTLAGTEKVMRDFHIYAIKGTPVVDDFIRHDRLEEDLHRIAQKLGIEVRELPNMYSDFRQKRIDYKDYYDVAARDKVAEIYAPEIELFGWEFDKLGPKTIAI